MSSFGRAMKRSWLLELETLMMAFYKYIFGNRERAKFIEGEKVFKLNDTTGTNPIG